MKTKVIQDEQKPHAVEIIADSIVQIAAAMRKIDATRLTREAIITLIHRNVGGTVSRLDIEKVLNSLDDLETRWLKKPVISNPPQS